MGQGILGLLDRFGTFDKYKNRSAARMGETENQILVDRQKALNEVGDKQMWKGFFEEGLSKGQDPAEAEQFAEQNTRAAKISPVQSAIATNQATVPVEQNRMVEAQSFAPWAGKIGDSRGLSAFWSNQAGGAEAQNRWDKAKSISPYMPKIGDTEGAATVAQQKAAVPVAENQATQAGFNQAVTQGLNPGAFADNQNTAANLGAKQNEQGLNILSALGDQPIRNAQDQAKLTGTELGNAQQMATGRDIAGELAAAESGNNLKNSSAILGHEVNKAEAAQPGYIQNIVQAKDAQARTQIQEAEKQAFLDKVALKYPFIKTWQQFGTMGQMTASPEARALYDQTVAQIIKDPEFSPQMKAAAGAQTVIPSAVTGQQPTAADPNKGKRFQLK